MQSFTARQPMIAFIGVGNMAGAIIKGLLKSGYPVERLVGTSRNPEKREAYERDFGVKMLSDNSEAVTLADMVVLSVKPIQMQAVIEALHSQSDPSKLFVSVAAGLGLESLQMWLTQAGFPDAAVVRSMPNTPSQLGAGIAGMIANPVVTDEQKRWVETMFASVGRSIWVEDEAHMHTVTALAGSAPAYFFRFLEAMIAYGCDQGLNEVTCRQLASHSMLGAARMATELDKSISQMRVDITSPNGTTEQALLSFEANDIDTIVSQALTACAQRSQSLASEFMVKTTKQ